MAYDIISDWGFIFLLILVAIKIKKVAKNHTILTETVSFGLTELGWRGDQEFMILILNPNKAVFLGMLQFSVDIRNSGLTLWIIFWVWVRVMV